MEGKAVFGGGQGKGGEADNKLNIDSIIARLLEGDPLFEPLSMAPIYLLSRSTYGKTIQLLWVQSGPGPILNLTAPLTFKLLKLGHSVKQFKHGQMDFTSCIPGIPGIQHPGNQP